jgi:hypothetical protein
MKLIDKVHFVVGAPIANINTAWDNTTYALGDYVNMANYSHLTIVLIGGASAGGTGAITVKQATDATGTSAKNVTVANRYLQTGTSSASDTWVKTTVTSNTWTHPATANLCNIVEIDAASLDKDNGFTWVAINITSAGGTTNMCALYILSDPRQISAETAPTAIA